MWVVNGLHQQTEGTLQLLDDSFCQIRESNGWVLIVEVLRKFGNAFGVGFSLKLEALGSQEGLEFLVIGDDTIVDDREFPSWVRSGDLGQKVHWL